ncbi:hypothetical protein BDV37DRAFT_40771 [Aspergillus pseudonomiae]|uniref:Uncharacterized protein n=1 Tax=Aspergillus pseudonomiae TaxID=1506151 RepID=A0A5N7DL12_9EURO|nr:uncharacterized protein BDV37DRAFT_40771 [Aspergillus pseudonomiae]KAE8407130.1 hypothetical protein BDV37DRAFT_40771 [Aspergillus pseudonomiae]
MAPIPEMPTRGQTSNSRSSRPALSSASRGHRDEMPRSRSNRSPAHLQGRTSRARNTEQQGSQHSLPQRRVASELSSRQPTSRAPTARVQGHAPRRTQAPTPRAQDQTPRRTQAPTPRAQGQTPRRTQAPTPRAQGQTPRRTQAPTPRAQGHTSRRT